MLVFLILSIFSLVASKASFNTQPCTVLNCSGFCLANSDNSLDSLVLQYRKDISQDSFNRTFYEFQTGFGSIEEGSYWLGLECQHLVTESQDVDIYVEVGSSENQKLLSYYHEFEVGGVETQYEIRIGGYAGDAGDILSSLNGAHFSSYDSKTSFYGCARREGGGWWYTEGICYLPNLNSVYQEDYDEGERAVSISTSIIFKLQRPADRLEAYEGHGFEQNRWIQDHLRSVFKEGEDGQTDGHQNNQLSSIDMLNRPGNQWLTSSGRADSQSENKFHGKSNTHFADADAELMENYYDNLYDD